MVQYVKPRFSVLGRLAHSYTVLVYRYVLCQLCAWRPITEFGNKILCIGWSLVCVVGDWKSGSCFFSVVGFACSYKKGDGYVGERKKAKEI